MRCTGIKSPGWIARLCTLPPPSRAVFSISTPPERLKDQVDPVAGSVCHNAGIDLLFRRPAPAPPPGRKAQSARGQSFPSRSAAAALTSSTDWQRRNSPGFTPPTGRDDGFHHGTATQLSGNCRSFGRCVRACNPSDQEPPAHSAAASAWPISSATIMRQTIPLSSAICLPKAQGLQGLATLRSRQRAGSAWASASTCTAPVMAASAPRAITLARMRRSNRSASAVKGRA